MAVVLDPPNQKKKKKSNGRSQKKKKQCDEIQLQAADVETLDVFPHKTQHGNGKNTNTTSDLHTKGEGVMGRGKVIQSVSGSVQCGGAF